MNRLPIPILTVELDKPRRLVWDFRAMHAAEEATGLSLWAADTWRALPSKHLRVFLWAALLRDDPELTAEQVGSWFGRADLPAVRQVVLDAWQMALPDPKERREPEEDAEKVDQAPPDWLTLWSIGRHDLGLSDDDFWALTPAQFDALMERRLLCEDRADLRSGVIVSVIANVNRDSGKHPAPFTPADFFPRLGDGKPAKQTAEEQLAIVEMLNAAFGGQDLRPGKVAESPDPDKPLAD